MDVQQQEGQGRLSRRGKVFAALASIGVFVAGAIASPALGDVYEWVRDRIFGGTVSETEVRQLNVVDYSGELREGYEVAKVVQGSCDVGIGDNPSAILANPNAYRCGFENDEGSFVADPCLAFDGGASVVCLIGPWDRSLIQIDLDSPVSFEPAYVASRQEMPWALEVRDPRHPRESWRCMGLTGATTPIAGNQPNWWCVTEDGAEGGRALNDLIIGDGGVWRILFSHPDEVELIEAQVAVAWY